MKKNKLIKGVVVGLSATSIAVPSIATYLLIQNKNLVSKSIYSARRSISDKPDFSGKLPITPPSKKFLQETIDKEVSSFSNQSGYIDEQKIKKLIENDLSIVDKTTNTNESVVDIEINYIDLNSAPRINGHLENGDGITIDMKIKPKFRNTYSWSNETYSKGWGGRMGYTDVMYGNFEVRGMGQNLFPPVAALKALRAQYDPTGVNGRFLDLNPVLNSPHLSVQWTANYSQNWQPVPPDGIAKNIGQGWTRIKFRPDPGYTVDKFDTLKSAKGGTMAEVKPGGFYRHDDWDGVNCIVYVFRASKATEIIIDNPLPNIVLDGIDKHGEINLSNLNLAVSKDATLNIESISKRTGAKRQWNRSSIIDNLENGDKVTFKYKITSQLNSTFSIPNITNAHISADKREVEITYNVQGLGDGIPIHYDYQKMLDDISQDYDRHGELDLSSLKKIANPSNHIWSFDIEINKHGTTSWTKILRTNTIEGLSTNDKLKFTLTPEKGYKIRGTTGEDQPLQLRIFTVPKLKTIDVYDPTSKIKLNGMETEGEINLRNLNISTIPDHTKLEIKINKKDGSQIAVPVSAEKITKLSNGDKIEFQYTTDGDYVITPILNSLGNNIVSDTWVTGSREERVSFEYKVENLNNNVLVPDIDRNAMKSYLSGQYENHGSLDVGNIIFNKVKFIKEIKLKLNGKFVNLSKNNSVLKNLSSNDEIIFVYIPENGFQIQNTLSANENFEQTFTVPNLKLLEIDDPTKKMIAVGKSGNAVIKIPTSNFLKDGYVNLKIILKHADKNKADIVRNFSRSAPNVVSIPNISNGDSISITYSPAPFTSPQKPYVIKDANQEKSINFVYDVNALGLEVDNTTLKDIVISGNNETPRIDIPDNLKHIGTHIEFSIDETSNNWVTKSKFLEYIKSTKGKDWVFPKKIFAKYVSDDPDKTPISFKDNKPYGIVKTKVQMIINKSMMESFKNKIDANNFIAFAPGTTSKNVTLLRSGIGEINELRKKYGLRTVFSNDRGASWAEMPLLNFSEIDPSYWIKFIPADSTLAASNENVSTPTIKFENVNNNIFKMDVKNIPILLKIEKKTLDAISNIKLSGVIDTSNRFLNWTINGTKEEPKAIKDLLSAHGNEISVDYEYANNKYKKLSDLLNSNLLDKDVSDSIKVSIKLKKLSNGKKNILDGATNGEIALNIFFRNVTQMISLTNAKGDLGGNDFISSTVSSSKLITVKVKNEIDAIPHGANLIIGLQRVDKETGHLIGNLTSTLNSVPPGEKYIIVVKTEANWKIVNSKNPMPNGTNEIRIPMKTILDIINPEIISANVRFSKFNGKGKIESFDLYAKNGFNKNTLVDTKINHMKVEFAKENENGTLEWLKFNSNKLSDLSNGDTLKIRIIPEKGYIFANPQKILTVTVEGLVKEVDLKNIKINKNLTFTGNDGHGSIDINSIKMTSKVESDTKLLELLKKGIIKLHFYVTNSHHTKIKFDGVINERNNNNLSVGDEIFGFYEITNKYKKIYEISNNPNDINNKIRFNDVSGLKVHPSVLGEDKSNDALTKILGASLDSKEKIDVILKLNNHKSSNVPTDENWHWEFGTSDNATSSDANPTISWKNNIFKKGTISGILSDDEVKSKTIYIRLAADPNYALDNPNYKYWKIKASDLKNIINVSSLGKLGLDITGINGKADVKAVTTSSSGVVSNFNAPNNTHLRYAIVSSSDPITDENIEEISNWETDPKKLNIEVGDNVVADLVSNNDNVTLSGKYYTINPITVKGLTVDMDKINGIKIIASGFNNHGILNLDLGNSESAQLRGLIWKVSVNSGNNTDIDDIDYLKNGDNVKLIVKAAKNYVLPPIESYKKKIPSTIVNGLKNFLRIEPNVQISINDNDFYGINKDGITINFKDGNIINGNAFIKKINLMSYLDGSYKNPITISDINSGKVSKIYDGNTNAEIKGIKLSVFFQINGGKPIETYPFNLKNGDVITAFLGVSSKSPPDLYNKYQVGDETVGFAKTKTTYIVHNLAVPSPDLGEIKVEIPERTNGNGTILIKTERPIPIGYRWTYQVIHKDGKIDAWNPEIPDNLSNDDVVKYKLIASKGSLINDYGNSVKISGLEEVILADEKIENMVTNLIDNMKFTGDNKLGRFSDETKKEIIAINTELRKKYKDKKNIKLSLELIESKEKSSFIGVDANKLMNGNHISVKLSQVNMKFRKKHIEEISGLRDSDSSVSKSLIWGISISFLGIFVIGAGFLIYKLLGKRGRI
ncbi:MAG: hypothetical protein HRT99_02525 [Mycoplasmatales bacterium]|nr:hypothetical protein [Mycoplasmatales bacterium]